MVVAVHGAIYVCSWMFMFRFVTDGCSKCCDSFACVNAMNSGA